MTTLASRKLVGDFQIGQYIAAATGRSCTERTAREYRRVHGLPARWNGRVYVIESTDVDEWLAARAAKGPRQGRRKVAVNL